MTSDIDHHAHHRVTDDRHVPHRVTVMLGTEDRRVLHPVTVTDDHRDLRRVEVIADIHALHHVKVTDDLPVRRRVTVKIVIIVRIGLRYTVTVTIGSDRHDLHRHVVPGEELAQGRF